MMRPINLRKNIVLTTLYVALLLSTIIILNLIIDIFSADLSEKNHYKHANLIEMEHQRYTLGRFPTDVIYSHLDLLNSLLGTTTYVTNNYGEIIHVTSNEESLIGTTIPHMAISNALLNKKTTTTDVIPTLFDEPKIFTSTPTLIDNQYYGALLIVSESDLTTINKEIYFYFIFTLVIFILLLSYIHFKILNNRTNKQILYLSDAVKKISKGDFSTHIETNAIGAIGELSKNMVDMLEKLGEYEDNRIDYLANISHDFRTPLTSIKGFVEAMQDGTIPSDSYEYYLNIIHNETVRLTSLTEELLVLNTLQFITNKLDLVNFNIQTVIKKVISQFEQQISAKKIRIDFYFDDESKCVNGDLNQIHRVIYNIIDNAINFSHENGSIHIKTVYENDKVYVSIEDNGEGISEADIPYIFSRFYKGDKSRSKDKRSGIGLAIVQEIINAHNQEIIVKSKLHVGTTVTFTLKPYIKEV